MISGGIYKAQSGKRSSSLINDPRCDAQYLSVERSCAAITYGLCELRFSIVVPDSEVMTKPHEKGVNNINAACPSRERMKSPFQ